MKIASLSGLIPSYELVAGGRFRVFVDGNEITSDCVSADDGAGLVRVVARDSHGNIKLTRDGKSLSIARIYGRGEIVSVRP